MTKFKGFIPFIVPVLSGFTSRDKADETVEIFAASDVLETPAANLQINAGGVVSNLEDIAEPLVVAAASGELRGTLYTETIEGDFQGARFQSAEPRRYPMKCSGGNTATLTVNGTTCQIDWN